MPAPRPTARPCPRRGRPPALARSAPGSWYAKTIGVGAIDSDFRTLDHAQRPIDPGPEPACPSPSTNETRFWHGSGAACTWHGTEAAPAMPAREGHRRRPRERTSHRISLGGRCSGAPECRKTGGSRGSGILRLPHRVVPLASRWGTGDIRRQWNRNSARRWSSAPRVRGQALAFIFRSSSRPHPGSQDTRRFPYSGTVYSSKPETRRGVQRLAQRARVSGVQQLEWTGSDHPLHGPPADLHARHGALRADPGRGRGSQCESESAAVRGALDRSVGHPVGRTVRGTDSRAECRPERGAQRGPDAGAHRPRDNGSVRHPGARGGRR
jgi:hypothetical protein